MYDCSAYILLRSHGKDALMTDCNPRTDIKDAATVGTIHFKVKAIILGMYFFLPPQRHDSGDQFRCLTTPFTDS